MSNTTLLIIAALLSLPGGLFVARLMSPPRTRWLGMVGGVLGAALSAIGLQFFVMTAHVTIDAISWFVGAFFACSMGVAIGALLANFFTSAGRSSDLTASEQ